MYIPYHSFHRRGVFKGLIKAGLQRYAVTNTHPADFDHMKALFMQRLIDRGYPVSQLQRWFAAVDHSCRVDLLCTRVAPPAGVSVTLASLLFWCCLIVSLR